MLQSQLPDSFYADQDYYNGMRNSEKKRRSRCPLGDNYIKDKSKRRREQNRISARESRKKKKEYMKTLEAEIQRLKEAIEECRDWACCNMGIQNLSSRNNYDEINQLKANVRNDLDKIAWAVGSNDPSIQTEIETLYLNYGVGSEERRKTIQGLYKEIIENSIPALDCYLLMSAQNNTEFFSEKIAQNEDNIEGCVNLNKSEKAILIELKKTIKGSYAELSKSIKTLINAKKDLQLKIIKFDEIIYNNIVKKFDAKTMANFLIWVQNRSEKLEFTNQLLFGLTKKDFDGFDFKYLSSPKILFPNRKNSEDSIIEDEKFLTSKKRKISDVYKKEPKLKRPFIFDK